MRFFSFFFFPSPDLQVGESNRRDCFVDYFFFFCRFSFLLLSGLDHIPIVHLRNSDNRETEKERPCQPTPFSLPPPPPLLQSFLSLFPFLLSWTLSRVRWPDYRTHFPHRQRFFSGRVSSPSRAAAEAATNFSADEDNKRPIYCSSSFLDAQFFFPPSPSPSSLPLAG